MGVFKEEQGKLIIDPEIKFIPEFRKLLGRDKDRRKRNAMNELGYIYYVVDYKSAYNIYDDEERIARSKKACGFEPDWKPDKPIKDAMKIYGELQQTPAIVSLNTVKGTLFTSLKAVRYVQNYLDNTIKFMEDVTDEQDGPEMDAEGLIKTVNELLKLSEKIPGTISTLEQVEEKVKLEQTTKRKIKGGGQTNFFED